MTGKVAQWFLSSTILELVTVSWCEDKSLFCVSSYRVVKIPEAFLKVNAMLEDYALMCVIFKFGF